MKLYFICWEVNTVQVNKSDHCFIQAIGDVEAQSQLITMQNNMPEADNFKLFSVGTEVV